MRQNKSLHPDPWRLVPDVIDPPSPVNCAVGAGTRRPRVLVVASLASSLVNFRFDLLVELSQRAEVLACAPDDDLATKRKLQEIGVGFRRVPMARAGLNPLQDIWTLAALVRICRDFRPDILFPYTMKPIIYGCLAGRLTGVRTRLPLCTGLGYVFGASAPDARLRAVRLISVLLYRVALKGAKEAIVYNAGDEATFRTYCLVGPGVPLGRVPGSGVNISWFPEVPPPLGPPIFLMVGRLLRMKGVPEYVAAARKLKRMYPQVRCQLLGPFDENPTSIRQSELEAWVGEGAIEYLGHTSDVRPYLAACSVFVLPSHGEGIARSVLEAMATGRAIVTTDAPGCPEPVLPGQTGFVVPVGDVDTLAAAMARFVEDPSLISAMGRAARRHAEVTFEVGKVNQLLMTKMGFAVMATGVTA